MPKVIPSSTPVKSKYSEEEAAFYLGVSLSTLRRLRRAGEGPAHVRIGSRIIYYPLEALRRL